jgi:hypothetical protein
MLQVSYGLSSRAWSTRTVVHSLEVIDKRQNIPVSHRDSLQYGDFVPDLALVSLIILQLFSTS